MSLKLSKHGGAEEDSKEQPWERLEASWRNIGRKWPMFALLKHRELPSLCVFALLPSGCLLGRAVCLVDSGPEPLMPPEPEKSLGITV